MLGICLARRNQLMSCHGNGTSTSSLRPMKARSAPTSQPMTGPRPSSRIASTGRLFIVPPSTSTSPLCMMGGSTPGMATEARSHSHSSPRRCTSEWPVVRFEETQKNSRGRSSMVMSPKAFLSILLTLRPETSDTNGIV